jgi:zinc protease
MSPTPGGAAPAAPSTHESPTPPSWVGLTPTREVLPNGVTVIVKESRTTPAVTIHACVPAGSALDPAHLGGLAHFAARTIDRGTASRTAAQIADAFDSRGASLAVSVNRHSLWLVCTCLVEDVADVMSLMADILRRPVFPEAEVETRRGEIVTLIRQDADSPAAVAMEGVLADLYGASHAYGRPARGTLESVARIDADALRRFHAATIGPGGVTLAVVGDIGAADAVAMVQDAFGDWPRADATASASPHETLAGPRPTVSAVAPATARRVRVLPMMNKAQADIAFGFITIARADQRYAAYWLTNNILAQYALGGRLGESIRERQGMAYYVLSAFEPSLIPGPFVVRAGVSAANVERALASIDAELTAFIADGPTDREMAESKQYLVGSLPRQLETNAAIAKFLVTSEFFGLDMDYELCVPGLLGSVTRAQVQQAARASLDPAHATVVVAGPYDGTPA